MSTALIDGDSILYKVGFALEEEFEDADGLKTYYVNLQNAKDFIDGLIDGILFNTDCDSCELWLGERGTNFRYKLSENLKDLYKHNRKDSRKPDKHKEMLHYIKTKHKSMSALDCEIDDVVVFKKQENPMHYVLCAIDKDVLYQSVGTHYNYGKDDWITVTENEAIYYAYLQTLTGDSTDGYKGCIGVGPVKAKKILGEPGVHGERTLWAKVLTAYRKTKQSKLEAYTTMRLAQMHQLKRNSEGKLRITLWTPPAKGEETIESLAF
jgi:DNA polymerase-1